MTLLSGLVFAFVLGTMAQNSESLSSLWGDNKNIQVRDDVFFVRAGADPLLDVLANDHAGDTVTAQKMKILTAPTCGDAVPSDTGISYLNSETCKGVVSFDYCIADDKNCAPATVMLEVKAAPVSVVDRQIPKNGELVPLPKKPFSVTPKNQTQDQPLSINAFVVTVSPDMEPITQRDPKTERDLRHYMFNTTDLNLDDQPALPEHIDTVPNLTDVPLSASLSARFVTPRIADEHAAISIEQNIQPVALPEKQEELLIQFVDEPITLDANKITDTRSRD